MPHDANINIDTSSHVHVSRQQLTLEDNVILHEASVQALRTHGVVHAVSPVTWAKSTRGERHSCRRVVSHCALCCVALRSVRDVSE